jgi:hypothetical protein
VKYKCPVKSTLVASTSTIIPLQIMQFDAGLSPLRTWIFCVEFEKKERAMEQGFSKFFCFSFHI